MKREQSSLTILIKALEGRSTTIELRNETEITGQIENVDWMMNIDLVDCVVKKVNGSREMISSMYLRGKNIRYVHIPADVDIAKAIDDMKRRFALGRNAYQRKPKKTIGERKGSLKETPSEGAKPPEQSTSAAPSGSK